MKLLHKNDNLIVVFDENEVLASKKNYHNVKNAIDMMPVLHAEPRALMSLIPTVADLSAIPYKYGGRIIANNSSKETIVGSAQFCGHERIIMTAAHCIHDGKNFYSNILFKKGYNKGKSTDFFIQAIGIKAAWNGKNFEYDYAFLIVNDKFEKDFYLQLDSNFQIGQDVTSFGYPGNYLAGEVMHSVRGKTEKLGNNRVNMPGNPFKEGASGGAWTVGNYAVGVTSTRTKYTEIQSPIFNEATKSLLDDMIKLI